MTNDWMTVRIVQTAVLRMKRHMAGISAPRGTRIVSIAAPGATMDGCVGTGHPGNMLTRVGYNPATRRGINERCLDLRWREAKTCQGVTRDGRGFRPTMGHPRKGASGDPEF